MAEKKCPECRVMIDSKAKTCPHCRKKLGTSLCTKVVLVLFIFIGMGAIGSAIRGPSPQSSTPQPPSTPQQIAAQSREERITAARRACKYALLEILHDPDSAKLKSSDEWGIRVNNDGTILVQPSGRTKNAFGAYMQGTWNCTAKPGQDGAKVISLEQIKQ